MKKILSIISILSICCSIFALSGCKDSVTDPVSTTKTDVVSSAITESTTDLQDQTENIADDQVHNIWKIVENEDGTCLINKYNGTDKILYIPKEINGLKVVGFTERPFNDNETIEEVYIPEYVTDIGMYEFEDCVNLKKVILPESLTVIGMHAFKGCKSLTEIILPKNLERLGSNAFWRCTNLTAVKFNGANLTQIPLQCFASSGLKEIAVPDGVTFIDGHAFLSCKNLEKVYIPDSVTKMEVEVFFDSPNVVIYGAAGSYAESYARDNNIKFVAQ